VHVGQPLHSEPSVDLFQFINQEYESGLIGNDGEFAEEHDPAIVQAQQSLHHHFS